MLPTIEKSEIFQKEIKEFQEKISKFQNETAKAEVTKLLNELVKEVRYIDNQHKASSGNFALPSSVQDSRTKISNIRKSITRKIEESR
jgi:superfamily I DNA/RNA helicase